MVGLDSLNAGEQRLVALLELGDLLLAFPDRLVGRVAVSLVAVPIAEVLAEE